MGLPVPAFVVPAGVAVSLFQPGAVFVPRCLISSIYLHDHGSKKGGLRTSEVVGAIRVQDGAVVFDFEKEILYHAAGQIDASGTHQSENNEVAVPAIHFVKPAPRDYILVFEIQQPGSNPGRINLTWRLDDRGKRLYIDFAALLQLLHGWWRRKVSRKVEDRCLG